jgi:microcystin-dependent protein
LYNHETGTIEIANATRYFNYASGAPITIKRFTHSADGVPINLKRFSQSADGVPAAVKRFGNYLVAQVDDMPTGCVYQFAGPIANIPSGFLFCNGASLLRANYVALFAAIGTIYGAADGTHFNLPDCRDKMAICASQDVSGVPKTNVTGALTQSGGSITLTHAGGAVARGVSGVVTVVESTHMHSLPANSGAGSAHTHGVGTCAVTPTTHSSQGGHTHDNHTTVSSKYGSSTGSPLIGPTTHSSQGAHTHDNHGLTWGPANESAHTHSIGGNSGAGSSHSHDITEPNSGAGHDHGFTQPGNHTAIPPYLAVVYIIKT